MVYSKKSAIEVNFNWLFVLLIGAVLLYFVFSLIRGQIDTTELEVDTIVKTRLETVFKQAAETPGTLFTVQLRGAKITSSDSCADSFYLNDNRNLRIEIESVFSPKEMSSLQGDFLLWVLPWEMPFRITNFVYLTSPDIVFLLVHENIDPYKEYAKQINHSRTTFSLPEEMLKKVIPYSDLNDTLNQLDHLQTRVVFINETCGYDYPIGADSAVCLEISETVAHSLNGHGRVVFLDENNNRESNFLGRASLIGAIFSEDHKQFTCSMQKAYLRMKNMIEIYKFRSSNLSGFEGSSNDCRTLHAFASHTFNNMSNCFNPPPNTEECLYDFSIRNPNSIANRNRQSKLQSCVYIY